MRSTSRRNTFAKRTIRKSQIISIFGVGSLYLFKNQWSKSGDQDSLMLAGLEAWENMFDNQTPPDGWKIFEPRLQARLKKEYFFFDFKMSSEFIDINGLLSTSILRFCIKNFFAVSIIF